MLGGLCLLILAVIVGFAPERPLTTHTLAWLLTLIAILCFGLSSVESDVKKKQDCETPKP